MPLVVISPVLQAKNCAGGMKNALLQNEQVPKVVVQCLNNQLDMEIVCDSYICTAIVTVVSLAVVTVL